MVFSIFTDVHNHHCSQFQNIFIASRRYLYTLAINFLIPYGPKQLLIHFLSIQILLYWPFHVNRITQYGFFFFCDQLSLSKISLRFIHVVVPISINSFLRVNITPSYRYTTFFLSISWLMDICINYYEQCCYKHQCTHFCGNI